jgi:hypothetical protein
VNPHPPAAAPAAAPPRWPVYYQPAPPAQQIPGYPVQYVSVDPAAVAARNAEAQQMYATFMQRQQAAAESDRRFRNTALAAVTCGLTIGLGVLGAGYLLLRASGVPAIAIVVGLSVLFVAGSAIGHRVYHHCFTQATFTHHH